MDNVRVGVYIFEAVKIITARIFETFTNIKERKIK